MNDGYAGLPGPDEADKEKWTDSLKQQMESYHNGFQRFIPAEDPEGHRRVAMVFVGAREMLHMVRDLRNCTAIHVLEGGSEIPEGCRVLSVHQDFMRNGFYLVLEHPSFDPVPPWAEPPTLDAKKIFNAVILSSPVKETHTTGTEYLLTHYLIPEHMSTYHIRRELIGTPVKKPSLVECFRLHSRLGSHPEGTLVGHDAAGNLWLADEQDMKDWRGDTTRDISVTEVTTSDNREVKTHLVKNQRPCDMKLGKSEIHGFNNFPDRDAPKTEHPNCPCTLTDNFGNVVTPDPNRKKMKPGDEMVEDITIGETAEEPLVMPPHHASPDFGLKNIQAADQPLPVPLGQHPHPLVEPGLLRRWVDPEPGKRMRAKCMNCKQSFDFGTPHTCPPATLFIADDASSLGEPTKEQMESWAERVIHIKPALPGSAFYYGAARAKGENISENSTPPTSFMETIQKWGVPPDSAIPKPGDEITLEFPDGTKFEGKVVGQVHDETTVELRTTKQLEAIADALTVAGKVLVGTITASPVSTVPVKRCIHCGKAEGEEGECRRGREHFHRPVA